MRLHELPRARRRQNYCLRMFSLGIKKEVGVRTPSTPRLVAHPFIHPVNHDANMLWIHASYGWYCPFAP